METKENASTVESNKAVAPVRSLEERAVLAAERQAEALENLANLAADVFRCWLARN